MKIQRRGVRLAAVGVTLTSALLLAACGGQQTGPNTTGPGAQASGQVRADGSSTVAPLTSAAAELFRASNPNVNVTVATSGTGGGFEQFCSGNTDISNASRAIKDEEKQRCQSAGIEFTELVVANDALTVVVNPANNWANCLTVEQLKTIWGPESERKVTNWNQVDPSFPDVPLALFGPGTDSGTFDYFTDEINGTEGASRTDYSASEDDNVLVQGVEGARGATAYFGYTYFEENQDKLKAVQVNGGQGCVAPSAETVQNGTYVPLARPLFIYVNNESSKRPEVAEFVKFYAGQIDQIAKAAQFVQLNEEQKATLKTAVDGLAA
ncbi:MAG: PstS family phosphate ABC transporter substrate-binding protein [Pseudonocardiaceae bacterium]